jgi:hypothetical protein
MRLAALAACAVLALAGGGVKAGTFSCEEINGVGNCGQLVQQTNQQSGGGTGTQTNTVTVNQSSGSVNTSQVTGNSVTVTNVNGVCEIVVNGHPPQPC